MNRSKADTFYEKETPFREGLLKLRELALQTGLQEDYKWNAPVYTLENKNVFGITAFKSHFGIWFFNGCYLTDTERVLENAQEGKTKAMRHWKFQATDEIKPGMVLAYMKEAVENQEKGRIWTPDQKKDTKIPELLLRSLKEDPSLQQAFDQFTPYKQREFCEFIETAKQEGTRLRRLEKILPMIRGGVGFNDQYRKR